MLNHDRYKGLCEIGADSPASPEDLASLLSHIVECEPCREAYERSLLATEKSLDNPVLIPNLEHNNRYRSRFLARARAEGLQFSSEIERKESPTARVHYLLWKPQYVLGTAVALLIILLGVGTYHWKSRQNDTVAKLDELRAKNAELQRMNGQLKVELSSADVQREAIDRKFSELTNEIAAEQRDRSATLARMEDLQLRLNQAKADIQNLTLSAEEQKAMNARSQQQAQRVAQMTDEIQSLRILLSDDQATLAARDTEIDKLTAELKAQTSLLDRENRLLAADRDVRELMGARTLHIIDIHDANAEGKDTKAFGRVFYTEGKSLIFYAFDLDHPRVSNAEVSFVGWGASANARDSLRVLGIFYVDDATQRRWVLKVDDPEILREIDAVFVSVEPSSRAAKRPTGQKLLYAYLNTQANHP